MPIATAAARPRSAYFVNVRVMRRMVFPQSSGDANNNGSALSMASATPTTMAATATTMEPAAVEATAMKTSGEAAMEAAGDTRPAAERVGSRDAAMIETAERAGMDAKLIMPSREALERAAMKSAAVSEFAASMEHIAAPDDSSAPTTVVRLIHVGPTRA